MIDDEESESRQCKELLHGTSRENIAKIIANGPDMTLCSQTAFGPGMYFALSEGDAQDYSSAKLMADISTTRREDGRNGKFVKFSTNYYDKISSQGISKISEITGIKPSPEDFGPDVPSYVFSAKLEIPFKIFDDYFRELMVDELCIDAAYCFAPRYHSCVIAFNPDSIDNIKEY